MIASVPGICILFTFVGTNKNTGKLLCVSNQLLPLSESVSFIGISMI